MNRQDLEQRLRSDAERLEAACPPRVRRRVTAQVCEYSQSPAPMIPFHAALAGALGTLAVFAIVWMLWQPAEVEAPSAGEGRLNAAPVVAISDRLLASREAALETEWQLLERDLRHLRDHVTATFDNDNPDG